MRLSDLPPPALDSNKTPAQPDNNIIAVKTHASHRIIPRFFKPLPSEAFSYLNHCLLEKMTHYESKID